MNENKENAIETRETPWMRFLTWTAKFASSNSSSADTGTAEWIGMTSAQAQLSSLGGRI